MASATFKIWRGEGAERRAARLHDRGVRKGMVVLDAVHQIQAQQADRSRRALELQGGEVRLVLGGGQRTAAADVHDAAERIESERAGHRRADAQLPADSRTS